ncbi:MAG TPA: AAA family ATPase, partial [Thermotogota bacterium]|nr:AAA family ATPase [Thermotogota bacterium]
MKKLPVGLQDFRYLRENDFVYVDKTSFLYQMIDSGKFFFLSRPRRFGKSLTVSTLKYLFQGEKALFQDTWIYGQWDWDTRYPVVHISMTEVDTSSPDRLEESLYTLLKEIYASFDLVLDVRLVKDAFRRLLSSVYQKTGQHIVLLIDEYDKPILDHLHE